MSQGHPHQASSQESIESFASAGRKAQDAFNRGDFESAFGGLSPDVEWRLLPSLPDACVLSGRDAVIRYFSSMMDAGTWQVETLEFVVAGQGRFVLHQRGTGTGRSTGIVQTLDFFQVWEVDGNGLVLRIHEYERRQDAFEAAGLRG